MLKAAGIAVSTRSIHVNPSNPDSEPPTCDGPVVLATGIVLFFGMFLPVESVRVFVASFDALTRSGVALGFEALLILAPGLLVTSFANVYAARECTELPGRVRALCRILAIVDLACAVPMVIRFH